MMKYLYINYLVKLKSKITVILLILTILCSSCSDFLEVEPESVWKIEDYYKSSSEVELALNGIYGLLATDDVFGRSFMYMDYGTDEGYYTVTWNEAYAVPLYRHTTIDITVKKLWLNLYSMINLCNNLLDRTDTDLIPEEEYTRLFGEARFLRGFAYYQLLAWYGEVPLRTKAPVDASDNHIAPASQEEIYAQIIEDLNYATENLPLSSNTTPGRANKMAAHGILARVYLKMAGYPLKQTQYYEAALEECQIVMSSSHGLTPSVFETVTDPDSGNEVKVAIEDGYRNHFLNYIQNSYDSKETLFEISFGLNLLDLGVYTHGKIGVDNGLSFRYGAVGAGYPLTNNAVCASVKMQHIYALEDLRRTWNIPAIQYSQEGKLITAWPLSAQYGTGKFRRWEQAPEGTPPNEDGSDPYTLLEDADNPDRNSTGINFPIIRYADVLLMHAEASNQISGPNSAALASLNEVRERAGLEPLVLGDALINTKEKFFRELVDERSRELCFEGLRKQDLIRWELLDDALQEIDELIKGDPAYTGNPIQVAMLRASESFDPTKHLTLPYPEQEVNINNKLEQKPTWK